MRLKENLMPILFTIICWQSLPLILSGGYVSKKTELKYERNLSNLEFDCSINKYMLFAKYGANDSIGYVTKVPTFFLLFSFKYYIKKTGAVKRFSSLEHKIDSIFESQGCQHVKNPYE